MSTVRRERHIGEGRATQGKASKMGWVPTNRIGPSEAGTGNGSSENGLPMHLQRLDVLCGRGGGQPLVCPYKKKGAHGSHGAW